MSLNRVLRAGLLLVLALGGCYFGPLDYPRYPDPPLSADKGLVIIFVGLTVKGQDLSSGMDMVTQDLHRRGIAAQSLGPQDWQETAGKIAATPGIRNVPVAIVGYSIGGNSATLLAAALKNAGIPVQTLVVIEGWPPSSAPCNVRKALDIFNAGLLSAGKTLGPSSDFSGEMQDINLDKAPAALADLNHWTISWSTGVRRIIENEVLDGDRVRRRPPTPGEAACFAKAPAARAETAGKQG